MHNHKLKDKYYEMAIIPQFLIKALRGFVIHVMHNSNCKSFYPPYDGPFIYQSRRWPLNEGMCLKQVFTVLSVCLSVCPTFVWAV